MASTNKIELDVHDNIKMPQAGDQEDFPRNKTCQLDLGMSSHAAHSENKYNTHCYFNYIPLERICGLLPSPDTIMT